MEEFWIQLLAVLTLLTPTPGASDTPELIGAVGGSVTFHVPKTDPEGKAALWSFGNIPIATVPFEDPSRSLFSKEKFITRLAVSEGGRALSISQLRMEDAGTYSVTIGGKISTFTLLVYTGASDTPELIGAVGGSVTFHSPKTDTEGKAAFWTFGNIAIVTVPFEDPPRPVFSTEEFKARFAVSEGGRALSVSQLRMEDAGTYSVKIGGKISTFTLLVYKELPEPTVTCEPQNCSGGICSFSLRCSVTGAGFGNVSYNWRRRGHLRDEGSVVELMSVKKSWREEPDPVTCTARNAVSSRNVTVTAPAGLCSEPGKGAPSGSWVRIGVVAGVEIAAILSVFLIFFCKSRGRAR